MSRRLIDLNEPLRRLRDDGFNIDIQSGNLIVRDVPYVDGRRTVHHDGILAYALNLSADACRPPEDHQVKFSGDFPCDANGKALESFGHSAAEFRINERYAMKYSFSAKPPAGKYSDDYEKVRTYVALISAPAAALDPSANPRTRRVEESEEEDSPFEYVDTASARAEINMITRKLALSKVAIVGVGGTGSYILDLVAKTPVKEIHLFDGDTFSSHNAYRAPGAASAAQLRTQPFKVDYFKEIYRNMHKGIVAHPEHMTRETVSQLRDMAFVFHCAEAGLEKALILDNLEESGVPFVDVGMGLIAKDERLAGILRVTASLPENRAQARARIPIAATDQNNEYDKNIQVADLNALNAALAVVRWKKLLGFYADRRQERHSTFTIANALLTRLDGNVHEED